MTEQPRRFGFELPDLRIRTKLIVLVGLLIAGIALFILWYFPSMQERQQMHAIAEKARSIVDMTAFTIAPALVFEDREAMRESFETAKQNKDLVYFVAVDSRERVVFSYNQGMADSARYRERMLDENISSDGNIYGEMSPVVFQNRELGRVFLGLSLQDLRTQIRNSRATIAWVSGGVFLFGILTMVAIASFITVPLRKMVNTAQRIAEGHLAERATVHSHDEVGVLAEAFNVMVNNLTLAQEELAEVNRSLEQRVENRTKELRQEIAQREHAQRILRQQSAAMEASIDGMAIFGPDDKCIYANAADAKTYGYDTPSELIGEPWTVLYEEKELARFQRDIMPALRASGQWKGEGVGRRKDGGTFSQELSLNTLAEVWWVCVVRDITKRRRAEEATNKLLRAVEQTDDVVFMTSLDGTITYVNPAFEKLYGFTTGEIVGKTPRMLKSGRHDPGYYTSFWQQILSGMSYRGEHVNRCKNGKLVTVEASVSPVFSGESTPTGFIAVQRDVTQKRQEEQNRENLEMQLAQAQKMESIGTLAGGIAHDFNNILGIILGHVALLKTRAGDPKRLSSSLFSIDSAVQRGAGLVRQILTFARKTEVLFEPIRLNEIVDEIVRMLHETLPKTITFKTLTADTDPIVEADRTQLHQTLLNLCVNARDAMPNGGSITLTTKEVSAVELQRTFPDASDGYYVMIAVTDTGSGMDQETMRRIFDPFFTTKEKGKGTGLGLAVVHGIVKNHQGFIDVKSELGRGTTFFMYFPLVWRREEISLTPEITESPVDGGSETILVVEDEEMLRSLLESVLTSHGYTVLTADDGEKAVQMYREHQKEVAVVVTDIGLPKMSGQDAFMKMKELNPDVKVILASGYLEPQAKADLYKAGAKNVVHKPYAPEEILMKVREVLK